MKKVFILFLMIGSNHLFSQTLTFTRISPEFVIGDTTGFQIVSYGKLNPSITTQIRMIRTIEDLTIGWRPLGTSICNYRACYPPDADTLIDSYTPGPSDDTISIHFYVRDMSYNFVHGAGLVRIRAELVSNTSVYVEQDFRAVTPLTIGIHQISSIIKDFILNQNYPNPFNPTTKINFAIPKSDYVSLRVYDILGREVKVLVSENLSAGEYEVDFDAKNLSSGMYYYSLRAGEFVSVKKMVLVK